jgi:hypothetical protein
MEIGTLQKARNKKGTALQLMEMYLVHGLSEPHTLAPQMRKRMHRVA